MAKCVVVLSGGQDSTVCLYWAMSRFDEVHAVTFDYGQRHRKEMEAAAIIGTLAGVDSHEFIKLGDGVLAGTSPLVSDNELEQYEGHDVLPGGLEKTFVPMRNQLFLTLAANRAYVLGCNTLVTGVSAEDYGGYPDCRPEFIEAFIRASSYGTFTGQDGAPDSLRVLTPLMHKTKKQTVQMALDIGVCYEASAFSHTAYDGAYPPTGKDHATLLRAKGFEEAGVPDPVWLRAYMEGAADKLPDTPNYEDEVVLPFLPRISWARKVVALAFENGDVPYVD